MDYEPSGECGIALQRLSSESNCQDLTKPLLLSIFSVYLHPLFHGVRTLTLTPKQDGTTHFNLKEELKGWFVILVKSSIEMAKENMEHYAMKLKTETEHRSKELVSSEH